MHSIIFLWLSIFILIFVLLKLLNINKNYFVSFLISFCISSSVKYKFFFSLGIVALAQTCGNSFIIEHNSDNLASFFLTIEAI